MKRILISFLTPFILAGVINSQSLKITNPNLKSVWTKGETYIIKWKIIGEPDSHVRISLYQSRTWKLSIASKTKNDGRHSWLIPYSKSLTPGKYTIRLKTSDGQLSTSSYEFQILNPAPKGPKQRTILRIGSPKRGDEFAPGEKIHIRCGYTGIPDSARVRIMLNNQNARFVQDIETSISISTDYHWDIPATMLEGKYSITVVVLNRKIMARTGLFTIKTKGVGGLESKKDKGPGNLYPGGQLLTGIPQIIVKFPKKNRVFKYDDRLTIDWTFKVFAKSSKVNIYLRQAKGKETYRIKNNYPITGPKVRYRLTPKIPTGDYYALVKYISGKYEEFQRVKPLGRGGPFKLEKGGSREIDPNQSPSTIKGGKVILHFYAKPATVKPKVAASLYYKYQNAASAYITNVTKNQTIKSLGNKPQNEGYLKVLPDQTSKYRLVVKTKGGAVSEAVEVKLTSELKIWSFEPNNFYPVPGEAMHLSYDFEGADQARFTDLGTGEKKNININGQYHIKGKYNFTFMRPAKYRLSISRKNGKEVKSADTWISVKNTAQWKQGIRNLKIIPNSRFNEIHVDIMMEVMGARSISIFHHRKHEVVKKLRRFHVDLKAYKLYKYNQRPHHKVPSKDFAANNYYTCEVVFWNGKKEIKTFSWK